MASAEALQKLETRAVAAEKLISLLKIQIAEAKVKFNPTICEIVIRFFVLHFVYRSSRRVA